jgi:hypothetical protein
MIKEKVRSSATQVPEMNRLIRFRSLLEHLGVEIPVILPAADEDHPQALTGSGNV